MNTNFWTRLLIEVCDFCQIISESSTQMLPLCGGAVQNNYFFPFSMSMATVERGCAATERNHSPSGLSHCGQAAFRSPMPSPQPVGFYFCKNGAFVLVEFSNSFFITYSNGFLLFQFIVFIQNTGGKIPPKFNLCLPLPLDHSTRSLWSGWDSSVGDSKAAMSLQTSDRWPASHLALEKCLESLRCRLGVERGAFQLLFFTKLPMDAMRPL